MFDFDTILDRTYSDSIKWHKYRNRDIIPMWVADMDFISPPAVIEVLKNRIDHGIFGYGYQGKEASETIINHLWRTYRWAVKPGWIVWLPGLVCGLNVTCRSVGQPGDSILTTVPVYPPFLSAPELSSRNLTKTRMVQSSQGWKIDFPDLMDKIEARTTLFMLCNPHNPTGRIFARTELERLAEICLQKDLVICSDEIHCDLLLEPNMTHVPMATLSPEVAQKTITLMAPSKTYNIPGLSCAFAVISNEHLRRDFKRTMAGIVPHVNLIGVTAAQAAYNNGHTWLKQLLQYLRTNRAMVQEFINHTKCLHMKNVEATYLAWIDVRQLNLNDPLRYFEKAGVGLSDGLEFDGPGFLRLNFGCSRPLLSKALKRMGNAISTLSA